MEQKNEQKKRGRPKKEKVPLIKGSPEYIAFRERANKLSRESYERHKEKRKQKEKERYSDPAVRERKKEMMRAYNRKHADARKAERKRVKAEKAAAQSSSQSDSSE